MAKDGAVVVAPQTRVVWQEGYMDDSLIAEAAIVLREYGQADPDPVYGIVQKENEIVIGGRASLLQLIRELKKLAKEQNNA